MRYFQDVDWVVSAVSRKKDGSMRNQLDKENRESFLKKMGLNSADLAIPILQHGPSVKQAKKGKVGFCDGLVTNEKGIILSLTIADCLPLFFLDCEKKAIALIHAGWRGLAGEIIKNTITLLSEKFNSEAKTIKVVIGPGICSSHFEVGEDVVSRFNKYPEAINVKKKRWFVDIKKIAESQLIEAEVQKNNIKVDSDCTFCLNDEYFSYRRDGSDKIKTMLCVFALKK